MTDEEVFSLYESVTNNISVPLCVDDNPGMTHFTYSDAMHGRIAKLLNVASIKIPPHPTNLDEAKMRVVNLRAHIPAYVTVGISGDHSREVGLMQVAKPGTQGSEGCYLYPHLK